MAVAAPGVNPTHTFFFNNLKDGTWVKIASQCRLLASGLSLIVFTVDTWTE